MLDTPYDIVSLGSVLSTQDEASSRHKESGRSTLVVAERQTQGRGRQGRTWDEPDRAMFSSFVFATDWPQSTRSLMTLCTAVALAETLEDACGVDARLKWPNDVLVEGRKVAGILVEMVDDSVTVGCGVNLWWPEHPPYAAAILDVDPGTELARELAHGWVDRLVGSLDAGPQSWPRDRYLERSSTIGTHVTWDGGSGRAVDLNDDGALVVATVNGNEAIYAGEVHTHQER